MKTIFLSSLFLCMSLFSQAIERSAPIIEPTGRAQVQPSTPKRINWIGVQAQKLDAKIAYMLNLPHGLQVNRVISGAPADKAKVLANDILLSLNGQSLLNKSDLKAIVNQIPAGETVPLTIVRQAKKQTLLIQIEEQKMGLLQKIPDDLNNPSLENLQKFLQKNSQNNSLQQFLKSNLPQILGNNTFPKDLFDLLESNSNSGAQRKFESELNRAFQLLGNQAPLRFQNSRNHSSYSSSSGSISISDDKGSINIESMNGQQNLIVKDRSGAILFSGPYTTDSERKSVPKTVRERLDRIGIQRYIPKAIVTPLPKLSTNKDLLKKDKSSPLKSKPKIESEQESIIMTDQKGSIEINRESIPHTIIATDPSGKIVYQGNFMTEADKQNIPDSIRKRLELLNK